VPEDGDTKGFYCKRCKKVTAHVFMITESLPYITKVWRCIECGDERFRMVSERP
jgi:RNase P subunit RPR2